MARTLQDLLAERRANVLEAARESCSMARAALLAHIAVLDAEIAHRTRPVTVVMDDEVYRNGRRVRGGE